MNDNPACVSPEFTSGSLVRDVQPDDTRSIAYEDELEARYIDIAALGAEIMRLEKALAYKTKEAASLHAQLKQHDPSKIYPDHADLVISELSRQLELRDQTLSDVIADRDRIVALVHDVFGTTSWKITSPLRKIKGMLRSRSGA